MQPIKNIVIIIKYLIVQHKGENTATYEDKPVNRHPDTMNNIAKQILNDGVFFKTKWAIIKLANGSIRLSTLYLKEKGKTIRNTDLKELFAYCLRSACNDQNHLEYPLSLKCSCWIFQFYSQRNFCHAPPYTPKQ